MTAYGQFNLVAEQSDRRIEMSRKSIQHIPQIQINDWGMATIRQQYRIVAIPPMETMGYGAIAGSIEKS